MCGIAGYVDLKQSPDEEMLRSMEQALAHRGPDEGKVWREGPCGLVHRRLRIIDLSAAAAQPMSNEDGQIWVIFNFLARINILKLRTPQGGATVFVTHILQAFEL